MSVQIDLPVLVTFMGVNLPSLIVFNKHGVVTRGYRWVVWDKKGKLEFEVACKNGMWGGSCYAFANSWGFGGPITNNSFRYNTLADCVTHLWKVFLFRADREDKKTTWLNKAKAEYEHFMTLKPEFQLKVFKEVDFYGED